MLASTNPRPSKQDFEKLLSQTLKQVNYLAKSNKLNGALLAGRELEPFIEEEMKKAARGTPFQNTIVRYGGQMFPDIVANKYFGVEVKSTKQNHWKTTGNSVLESTRIKDVERIYMMFGKLASPIEFRCRPYEDCLSDVVVTHSPRYLIDMDLPAGATIFDKMRIQYDILRIQDPPLDPVLNYYRSKLKPGEQIWWLGNSSSLIIRPWASLEKNERDAIRIKGFVFFPEIFSNRPDKFNKMATWLMQEKNIVCPNMRDIYSAGGKATIKANGNTYKDVPRTIVKALEHLGQIRSIINSNSLVQLGEYWGTSSITSKTAFNKWISVVTREVTKGNTQLPVTSLFRDYIAQHKF